MRQTRSVRSATPILSVLLMVAGLLLFDSGPTQAITAGPARAVTVDLICTGNNTTTYTPGLTYTEKQTTTSGQGSYDCPVSSNSKLDHADYVGSGARKLSCLTVGNTVATPGTQKLKWNTGTVSEVTFSNLVFGRVNGIFTAVSKGTVISGEFAGDDFTQTIVYPNLQDLTGCLTPEGVTSLSGNSVITFSHL